MSIAACINNLTRLAEMLYALTKEIPVLSSEFVHAGNLSRVTTSVYLSMEKLRDMVESRSVDGQSTGKGALKAWETFSDGLHNEEQGASIVTRLASYLFLVA
jgi:hypothetical protein